VAKQGPILCAVWEQPSPFGAPVLRGLCLVAAVPPAVDVAAAVPAAAALTAEVAGWLAGAEGAEGAEGDEGAEGAVRWRRCPVRLESSCRWD
jgi:hypothetical protein